MDRRRYLALAGTGVSLAIAGCTGGDGDDDNGGDTGGDDSTDDGAADDSGGENGGSTGDGSSDDGGSDGSENGSDGGDNGTDDDSSNGGENGDDNGGDDSSDGGENGSDNDGENGQSNPTVEFQSISAVSDLYDSGTVKLSDSGGTVSDAIPLSQGVIAAEFEHQASGNFIIRAVDGPGTDKLLVNRIGAVSGVAGALIRESGEYRLEIDADGEFTLTLATPDTSAETPPMVPVSASGAGPDVVGPVELSGGEVATASHSGDSNFIVEVAREDASGILGSDIVYNEIGSINESEAVVDLEGRCWLLIEADGDWSIELE